jgi:hypothetical protein
MCILCTSITQISTFREQASTSTMFEHLQGPKALNEHLHHSCNSMCLTKSPNQPLCTSKAPNELLCTSKAPNEPLCTSKAPNKHLSTSKALNQPMCTSNAPNQPLCTSNAPNQPLCTSHTQCLTRPPPNYLATKELSLATHMSGPITY